MKIFALCSWFDEEPEHLTRLVESVAGFCGVFVGLDGAYATFPGALPQSPADQRRALQNAVYASGMEYKLTAPYEPWASEVEKRATLFELGRQAGATPDDWFLIMDADMTLARSDPAARGLLSTTKLDSAEVAWQNIRINDSIEGEYRFRSLFRALPGLTVERTHWLYTVDCPLCDGIGGVHRLPSAGGCGDCDLCLGTGRRFVWHLPNGHISGEPALDLTPYVLLKHFNSQREVERKERARTYYRERDKAGIESAGDWV